MKRQRKKRRLFFVLFFFFFAILVVLFFQSSISRIDHIIVNGIERLSAEDVIKQSKIQYGDQILLLSPNKVKEILQQNPLIKQAEVSIQFPGKVLVNIHEHRTVGYLLNIPNEIKPILENGTILDKESKQVINQPIITEWSNLESLPSFCKELAHLNEKALGEISEIRLTPSENDPFKLILYMRDGFEVHTSSIDFANQLKNYPYIMDNLQKDEPGVINLTDAGVYYISFQELRESIAENSEKKDESTGQKQ